MRVRPLVGQKLWFRPRGLGGWGWFPASWEGWVVLAAYMALVLGTSLMLRNAERAVLLITVVATALLVTVATLKGTTPGGPKRLAQYRRLTEDRGDALHVRRTARDDPDLIEVLENLEANRHRE